MTQSRAKKDAMSKGTKKDKNWMEKAFNPENKGKLHEALGVTMNKKIPKKKLDKAVHSTNPLIRKEANLAKTARRYSR